MLSQGAFIGLVLRLQGAVHFYSMIIAMPRRGRRDYA